jgi:pilus assembly protein Flp/PilA
MEWEGRKSFISREIGRFLFPRAAASTRIEETKMSQLFRAFVTDDEGQGLVEYALLLALIAIVSIIAITNLGTKVKTVFETIDGKMKV